MNLSTARSTLRSREVGMRKVLGSTKSQLIKQFLAESVLLTFIAVLVAIVLVEAFLPSFNQLANKKLEITFFNNWLDNSCVAYFCFDGWINCRQLSIIFSFINETGDNITREIQ